MEKSSDLGQLTKQLIEALSQKPVNVLIIRLLCRNHPGLIASAGLRLQTWATLLLGSEYQSSITKKFVPPITECEEQHVLEADVHRTRADSEYFRLPETRAHIQQILQKFCVDHAIQYKQGMNEVLAPFLAINHSLRQSQSDGSSPSEENYYLYYQLFKAFLFRYLERFFCVDDSSFLYKSFRLFHLLLLYHDPQLAYHLNDLDFTPEFYAPQWFLTLYARALPLPQVLRLWDMMISVDDPAFLFFIGVILLIQQRESILRSDHNSIPEVMTISFQTEEAIDVAVKEAWELYQITPRCLLRQLRLCCVSTVELSTANAATMTMKINTRDYDQLLSIQSVRNCFAITSQELIESMMNSKKNENDQSLQNTNHLPQQYVIIDIRSYEESIGSGGGTLPRAIQLEPEFLNRPEAFEVWLQHFDGTRGCNIVIIDLPPPQWTGMNLWRRLLLGEGDGQKYAHLMNRYEVNNFKENQKRLEALIIHSKRNNRPKGMSVATTTTASTTMGSSNPPSTLSYQQIRDEQSKFYKDEENMILSDVNSPAMLLAMVLQRNGFPRVSVLEGGFPQLIDTLLSMKGNVEPIVVDHDHNKWIEFLRNTGRYHERTPTTTFLGGSQGGKASKMISLRSHSSDDLDESGNKKGIYRKEKDLSDLERYELALLVADRLQHKETRRFLQERIDELRKSSTTTITENAP